jgi:K+-sensing histidine kinase KdpD
MTTERRRAIITISATLIIGILIGSLTSGLWGRKYYGQRSQRGRTEVKMNFEKKLLKAIDADDAQVKILQPIMRQTMLNIDSLQHKTDSKVRVLLDSLDVKLKSVLKEEQYLKFKKFVERGRGTRKREEDNKH